MTADHRAADHEVLSEVEHPHRHACRALDDPSVSSLAAVSWASAHLAAVERVLYPAAVRLLPDGRDRVRAQVAVDARLQRALWRLDRRLTGDVHVSRMAVRDLEDQVRAGLDEHAAGERPLVEALRTVLDPQEQQALSDRLAKALLHGPTRPHPDTHHSRFVGGLPFWFGGVVDRVRDGLDSRSVPMPRAVQARRPVGRWSAYVMGVPYGERTDARR